MKSPLLEIVLVCIFESTLKSCEKINGVVLSFPKQMRVLFCIYAHCLVVSKPWGGGGVRQHAKK